MSDKNHFYLKNIVDDSISQIQDMASIHNYLLELSKDELTQRLDDSKISELAQKLVQLLLEDDSVED